MESVVQQPPVAVSVDTLADIAVEVWRLDQWLKSMAAASEPAAPARYAVRRLSGLLLGMEMETIDLTGQPYEPGLAVEVLEVQDLPDSPGSAPIVAEMILPICTRRGTVVRHGQVVTGPAPDSDPQPR